jgi:hypothetical protein
MNSDAFLYVVQLKDHSKSAHSEPIKTSLENGARPHLFAFFSFLDVSFLSAEN